MPTDWDERERQRRFHEAVMRDQAAAERDRLARVVEAALDEYDCTGGMPWDEVADIAIKALVDDGVIFASIGVDHDYGFGAHGQGESTPSDNDGGAS